MIEEEKSLLPRLSEAYPPNTSNNSRFVSDNHYFLKDYDMSKFKASDVIYRPVKYKSDMNQIKQLHQEWFPINYSQDYYDQVFKNSHLTMIAELKVTLPTGRKENIIIGSMFYRIRVAKRQYMCQGVKDCGDIMLRWLGVNQAYAIYIMTLGVINEFRGQGIAQKLLQHLIDLVRDKEQVKYIYLDMVTYNRAAARFYTKNGFVLMNTKNKHYQIEGNDYDAYVYVWHTSDLKRRQALEQIKRQSMHTQVPIESEQVDRDLCEIMFKMSLQTQSFE